MIGSVACYGWGATLAGSAMVGTAASLTVCSAAFCAVAVAAAIERASSRMIRPSDARDMAKHNSFPKPRLRFSWALRGRTARDRPSLLLISLCLNAGLTLRHGPRTVTFVA